jgi:hypothetical protein
LAINNRQWAILLLIVVPIRIPVSVAIAIHTFDTGGVDVPVVIGYHTGVRRYGIAVGVLWNVGVSFDQPITLIRIRIAEIGIVHIGAISVVGSAAARQGYGCYQP